MPKGMVMVSDKAGRALWCRKPKWEALSPNCLLSKSVRFLVVICFLLFFKKNYVSAPVYVWVRAHACSCLKRPEDGAGSFGVGVRDGSEPLSVGAGI